MSAFQEFWWLPDKIDWRSLLVEVGHHEPLHEEDDRTGAAWVWKAGVAPELVDSWRAEHSNRNVYRKLVVTTADKGRQLVGPIVLDIDHEEVCCEDGRIVDVMNDLDVARRVALSVWKKLEASGLGPTDCRAYFSGRKGYQFEVRPTALGILGSLEEQIDAGGKWEDDFISSFRLPEHCNIDRVFRSRPFPRPPYFEIKSRHSSVRLQNSLNCWFELSGRLNCQARSLVNLEDLSA